MVNSNNIASIKIMYQLEDLIYEEPFTRDISAYRNSFLFCPYGYAIASHYNWASGDNYYFNGSIAVVTDSSPIFNNIM